MSRKNGNGDKPVQEPEIEPVGVVSDFQSNESTSLSEKEDELDPQLIDPYGMLDKQSVLPGFDGLPFRGRVPSLKDTDRVQPQTSSQVYVHVLDLSNEKHLKLYRQICQVVGNGMAQISVEERKYDEEKKNWRVFIRWMLNYTHMPSESGSLFM